jgi:hypothetical protein
VQNAETAGVYLTGAFFCAIDGPSFQQGHLSGEKKNFFFSEMAIPHFLIKKPIFTMS